MEAKAKIFFDVCRLFFDLSFQFSFGLNRPLPSMGVV